MRNGARSGGKRGQGLTEYVIIVAVVSILSLGVMMNFGDTLRMWLTIIGERITGTETTTVENKMSSDYAGKLSDI